MIIVGKMDKRISLYKKNKVGGFLKDDLGQIDELFEKTQSLENIRTIWAEVNQLKSSEKIEKNGITLSEEQLKIITRYFNDIDKKSIVRYRKVDYEIISIKEIDRKKHLEIICRRTENV